ncbi:MAG: C4-dicarboxylate ABC transporter, partial [Pseudomonadota bacterium]
FIVPFIFAFYPELLLINEAILDPQPTGGNLYLPGYDGDVHVAALALLLARLVLALYLVSSALSGYDQAPLAPWEIALRLLLAVLILASVDALWVGAAIAAFGLILMNHRSRGHAEPA